MEPRVVALFPHIELEHLRTLFFWLTFTRAPHGSGTTMTRADVLEMELQEIEWHHKYLWDVWEREAAASRGNSE